MSEFEIVGRYITPNTTLTILGLTPGNQFHPINTLTPGTTYPIAVTDLIGEANNRYMRFRTYPDSSAIYPGSNFTYIRYIPEQISNVTPTPYVPQEQESTTDHIFSMVQKLFLLGAGAYIIGKYFTKK